MATMSSNIGDLIGALNKLRNNTGDPDEQDRIQKILRVLLMDQHEVIRQTFDENTADYQNALSSLTKAQKDATDAIDKIKKISEAINTAAGAAKALDKLLKIIITVFP